MFRIKNATCEGECSTNMEERLLGHWIIYEACPTCIRWMVAFKSLEGLKNWKPWVQNIDGKHQIEIMVKCAYWPNASWSCNSVELGPNYWIENIKQKTPNWKHRMVSIDLMQVRGTPSCEKRTQKKSQTACKDNLREAIVLSIVPSSKSEEQSKLDRWTKQTWLMNQAKSWMNMRITYSMNGIMGGLQCSSKMLQGWSTTHNQWLECLWVHWSSKSW